MVAPFDENIVLELEEFGIPGPQRCAGEAEGELTALQKEGKPLPEGFTTLPTAFTIYPPTRNLLNECS